MTGYAEARRNMIVSQLEPNQVTDELLLSAMGSLPREIFVPPSLGSVAYMDGDLLISSGRHLIQPMVLARMIQEAEISAADIVLDVGCGPGYSTAVMAHLAATVVGLEPDPDLVHQAGEILSRLEIDNAAVVAGPPAEGREDQGPYDVIILNGSVGRTPERLLSQLSEGGRLICVRLNGRAGKAFRYERQGDVFGHRPLFDAAIPVLPDLGEAEEFVF